VWQAQPPAVANAYLPLATTSEAESAAAETVASESAHAAAVSAAARRAIIEP
jgi:hypothetical protein